MGLLLLLWFVAFCGESNWKENGGRAVGGKCEWGSGAQAAEATTLRHSLCKCFCQRTCICIGVTTISFTTSRGAHWKMGWGGGWMGGWVFGR